MKVSVILCSYGRPEQLSVALDRLDHDGIQSCNGEVVLVCKEDDILTQEVMLAFSQKAPYPVSVHAANRRGLSIARNYGIFKSKGKILIFSDDDCYQQPGYIEAVCREMDSGEFQYGGGATIDLVESLDGLPHIRERQVLKPGVMAWGGVITGSNMFFLRSVFETLHGFRHDMGASSGTSFVGPEDWEMTTRCALAGLKGILIPDAIVIHDHHREIGSEDYIKTQTAYHTAGGALCASLIAQGIPKIWEMWAKAFKTGEDKERNRLILWQLRHQFHGASEYLDYILKNNLDH